MSAVSEYASMTTDQLSAELQRVARRVANDMVSRVESDELPALAAEIATRLSEVTR